MKKTLLFLFLLSIAFVEAKENIKMATNPRIGIVLVKSGDTLKVKVKNVGNQVLKNVTIDSIYTFANNNLATSGPEFSLFYDTLLYDAPQNIGTLQPDEETEILRFFVDFFSFSCESPVQLTVRAEDENYQIITDVSNSIETFGNPDYEEFYISTDTFSFSTFFFYDNLFFIQYSNYFDANSNNLVDIGDQILHTYSVSGIFSSSYEILSIFDNNAEITSFGNGAFGVHNITQEEIDFGYVYNSAYAEVMDACGLLQTSYFFNANLCFNCPNPNNEMVVTPLSDFLPHKITGKVSFDLNDDGCGTGINYPRRAVRAVTSGLTYRTFTNNLGLYQINIPNINQNYTVSALENLSASFSSTPATQVVNSSQNVNSQDYNNTNFCLNVTPDFNDLKIIISPLNDAIPGMTAKYIVFFENGGTTIQNGTIGLTFDGVRLTFATSSEIPVSQNATSLSWNFDTLMPFESRTLYIDFSVLIPPIVNLDDILTFTVEINPIANDATPGDNTFVLNQTVRSSYDPNDKTVLEGAFITLEQVNNYLTYLTRFQNSGTANANLVKIKEVLDANLDWNTFTPIAESHNGFIEILNGNELTYTFPNIDLPYESIEPELSIGWMLYKIKPKPGFAIGDIASSKSDIYFDFNPPIITNTVTTQIAPLSVTAIARTNFTISPNPTSNSFTIAMKEIIDASYEIVSINGKTVSNGIVKHMQPIAIDNLEQGFYFVTISTLNDKMTYKLVKK